MTEDSHYLESPESFFAVPSEDQTTCSICKLSLGKRKLRPRHHCRICGRCVCGPCSPSTVRLHDWPSCDGKAIQAGSLQRACTECVDHARRGEVLKTRIQQLAMQLQNIVPKAGEGEGAQIVESLTDAVSFCEQSLGPVKDMYKKVADHQAFIEGSDQSIVNMFNGGSLAEAEAPLRKSLKSIDKSMESAEAVLQVSRRLSNFNNNRSGHSLATSHSHVSGDVSQRSGISTGVSGDTSEDDDSGESPDRKDNESAGSHPPLTPPDSPSQLPSFVEECGICNFAFGKHLKVRHQCCICQRSVCASCSSQKVWLNGDKNQTVCTVCMAQAPEAHSLRPRIVQLSNALISWTGAVEELPRSADITTALSACEKAVVPLESTRKKLTELEVLEQRIKAEVEKRRREAEKRRKANTAPLFDPERAVLRSWSDGDDRFAEESLRAPRHKCLSHCSVM